MNNSDPEFEDIKGKSLVNKTEKTEWYGVMGEKDKTLEPSVSGAL